MKRSLGGIFIDSLDALATGAINERFNEAGGESSEGSAEFANPATVTQPVHHSQTPAGVPLNNTGSGAALSVSPVMLLVGGLGVMIVGLVFAKLLK